MPEGHIVHRLAELHRRRFAGNPVRVTSPQGRFTAAEVLDGGTFRDAGAHGKHLWHRYAPDRVVHVHLGLYGKFTEAPVPLEQPRGKVRMRLIGPTHGTDLRGPTACELLTEDELTELLARLGPDPLRSDADSETAWQRVTRSRSGIAALLLDQSVLAGVGNAYRAEVLFRQGIPPRLPGNALSRECWDALWGDLVDLMSDGVRTGRIDTVRGEHSPEATGRQPRNDRHGGEVYVYRRAGAPCLVCATPIGMTELLGRKLYWCPRCQGE
ncbi:endonuclease-8 [Actinopolyspora mzabensis]|uniref:DNA-(apurinic or apyrimidinic site) lyase n=1 Tax=Actinopolyspora mzabensis TaxID=995066 RepID=A0A1G9E8E8_ACTMZ|nr:DNA-formamidopyrimidine glycosylase family protein [Actinopolyspora mzabensis]SDK72412.1 endonuclease-8 [Actinopolyspora mzabensis]